jgi:hypothetical protein
MWRPSMAGFAAAAPGTAKAGKPQPDLAEQRCDRMVPIVLEAANLAATATVRPPDGVALGLCRDDRLLQTGQHQLRFGQGQAQVGDIIEISRPVDRHDVNGLLLTVSLGFHQLHNPSHASTPNQRTDAKLSRRRPHPQSPGSPAEYRQALIVAEQLEQLGQARNDTAARLSGHTLHGATRLFLGKFVAARAALEQSVGLADPVHRAVSRQGISLDLYAMMLTCLAMTLAFLGYIDQARSRMDEAVSEARRLSHAHTLNFVLAHACWSDAIIRSRPLCQ